MQLSIQKKITIGFIGCLIELLAFVGLLSLAEYHYTYYEFELKE